MSAHMSENNVPVVDPGPGMVSWLTYLDSRLEQQDKRAIERGAEIDKKFERYEQRFDKLEDLIRETNRDASATREQVIQNGIIASLVSALVAFGSRYMGS